MEIKKQIGQRIREERKEKKISQTELSKIVNTTQDTISLWEKGKSAPNIEDIIKLSDYFKISIEELIGIEKDKSGKYIVITNYGQITIQ